MKADAIANLQRNVNSRVILQGCIVNNTKAVTSNPKNKVC